MSNQQMMHVTVVRGSEQVLEVRPIVNVINERIQRVDPNGQIVESRSSSRKVPLLFSGEIEHIAVSGESTIVRVGA